MAGIFAPTLQSEVSPVRAVETPSAAGALARLADSAAEGFFRAQEAREKRELARAPSYTERKDQFETKVLGDYTRELTALQQTADQNGWSSTELARKQSNLDLKYLQAGLDTSSAGFKAAKTTVTGKPAEDFGISEDELYIQSVQSRDGGEGLLVSAKLDLISKDLDPNDISNVAANLRDQEAKAAELVRLTTDETLTVASGKKIFTTSLDDLINESQTAIQALTSAGASVPAEAIQNQYLKVRALEQQARSFIARNPNADDNDIADIEKAITRAEAVFEVAGVQFEDGEFKQMGPVELKAADRLKQTISILQSSPDAFDNIIASLITDAGPNGIGKNPDLYIQAEARIKALGDIAPVQPDWITEESIIVSNSLMQSYDNLINYQNNPERTMEKAVDGAMSLLSQDERDKWMGMDNVQSWSAVKAYSSAAKITGDNVSLTPRQAEATFKNIVAMSVGFEQIDINSEAVSFDGIRNEISADLPRILAKLKQADPTKGRLAEEMVYRSLVGQKLAYDQRVKSDEAAMNVVYEPTTNSYNFRDGDLNDKLLRNLVSEKYGGDIQKLRNSDFRGLRLEDVMSAEKAQKNRKVLEDEARFSGGGMSAEEREAAMVASYVRSKLPDEAALKNLTDLRNSSVYLSRLGAQLEPEGAKEARQIAQETADAVGATEAAPTLVANGPVSVNLGIDFGQIETDAGLPSGFLERTAQIESSGNPAAKNPSSSAGGLFQQIDSNAKQYGVTNRFDPMQSTNGAVRFAQDNQKTLRKTLGRDPTAAELYLAHQQGGGGASALLGNSSENVVSVLTRVYKGNEKQARNVVRLNGGREDMTAGEFANIWINKFNSGKGSPTSTPEVTVTPLADRGPEVQASAPVASMAPAGGTVGATGIPAEATLDPTITQDTPENQVGDAPSAPTDQAAALGQAEGLSTEVQGFLANLDEDIPADKVQALLDYFGIDVNEQFGNREEIIDRAMAKALSMGGTDEGKFSKAEALQYFLDKLQG